MNITVVGPGAVGLLFAARLAQAGASVTLLDHRPERAALMEREGVLLEDEGGQVRLALAATADPAAGLAGAELALVCVKAYHTEAVARTLAGHLPAGARALTLQNGMGNVEALVAALGEGRVLGGITSEGATLLGPGRVRHAGRSQTHLGPVAGPVDALTRRVAAMFAKAGFSVDTAEGVGNLIWTKLVINVGLNALTAILGVANGRLLKLPAALALMGRAVDEALAVGGAMEVRFLYADMREAVRQVAARSETNLSSMLQDVRARRRTEVEFINGAVARQGRRLEVPTPVNQTLCELVLALEQDYA